MDKGGSGTDSSSMKEVHMNVANAALSKEDSDPTKSHLGDSADFVEVPQTGHEGESGDDDDDDDDDDVPPQFSEGAEGDDHDEEAVRNGDEYGPENPLHGSDEYDPAHPEPAHAQDEYDPANPGAEPPVETNGAELAKPSTASSTSTTSSPSAGKRKPLSPFVSRSPKRPRLDDKPDQRGLRDSAWDRLMDLESTGEFKIAQVSRAAFSAIAALPEFAQYAIIARFARTPLKNIRDKNALITSLHQEYLVENPHLSSLKPVAVFAVDGLVKEKEDDDDETRGRFEFGYAPPMPTTGVSSVQIPFRRDKPGVITTTTSAMRAPSTAAAAAVSKLAAMASTAVRTSPVAAATQPVVDEFGRAIVAKTTSAAAEQVASRPSDPRRSSPQGAEERNTAPATSSGAAPAKPSDPRRRRSEEAQAAQSSDLPPHTAAPSAQQAVAPKKRYIVKSDIYKRLPINVRSGLDKLIHEHRLPEEINDNVLSRLNHLHEATAMNAVEKFSEVDLHQIANINGFLVGIINRVQERTPQPMGSGPGSSSRDRDRDHSFRPSPKHQYHQQHQQQQERDQRSPRREYTSGRPLPSSGRHVVFETAPMGAAHQQQYATDPRLPPVGQQPVVFARHAGAAPPPASSHLPVYAEHGQRAWNAPVHATGGAAPGGAGPPPSSSSAAAAAGGGAGRFSSHPTIDQAIGMLPVSVQNHLLSLVNSRNLPSLDDLSEKCYEVLGQLSEGLANEVLKRFGTAQLATVRNRSGFLIGVVKKCRQEYGFN